ncbi:hypothetical protein YA0002_17945 [Pseudomonas cichorii]|uniref:DNA binding HTH domain-containing protein n=1 Tax=Pseudomonas serbiensis TaxID=3064350 RepID=A0ABT9D0X1_9PSED|nr:MULTISPECIES: hypothetical protein [Pseudomonas]MBI6854660.1 hypothetical protein [Pseudomonas cichorii]MDO7930185.1 hypothetical protein [Pseudomonas sp. KFB-138]
MRDRFDTSDNDPPPLAAKVEEQESLAKAIAEFLASGRKVISADHDCTVPLNDEDLLAKLKRLATEKRTLAEAAIELGQPQQRCRDIAVKHRIPFRSQSFLKRRPAK